MTEPIAWSRWLAKKAARTACVLASPASRSGCRALMYHRVRSRVREPFSVSPSAFEGQVRWLAERGGVLSLEQLMAALRARRALPDGAVVLTIDDGYRDVYTTALPILRRYRVPAVLFVTVGAIEDRAGASEDADAHVSWDELAALREGGIEVASHGWDHCSLARMPASAMVEQLERSRSALVARLGVPVDAFAYPFGTRADYSPATTAAARRAGYSCVFTAQHGAIHADSPLFELPRIKIEGGEPAWMFRRIVYGGLDRWGTVDRYLWQVQASEPTG